MKGLGKTIQAIGIINATGIERALIVCPASLKINWRRELERWLVRKDLWAGIAGDMFPASAHIVIINYEQLKKHWRYIDRFTWPLLVIDEAHKVKNPRAQRTELVNRIRCERRLYLTGTPIVNRPVELWPLISKLAPDVFNEDTEGQYKNRYCWVSPSTTHGRKMLAELQDKLRSTCFTGDTMVSSEHGTYRIAEIVQRHLRVRVWSEDCMGRLSLQPIVGWNAKAHRGPLVRVEHSAGAFVCTPEHLIQTQEGWTEAGKLTRNHFLSAMCTPIRASSAKGEACAILLGDLCQPEPLSDARWRPSTAAARYSKEGDADANGQAQPEALRGTEGPDDSPRRGGAVASRTDCVLREAPEERCAAGASGEHRRGAKGEEDVRARGAREAARLSGGMGRLPHPARQPDVLRGHRSSTVEDSDRGGRPEPCAASATGARQETRRGVHLSRVVGVEILAVGDRRGTTAGTGQDTTVYDIEVQGNHNFFANGILVHNCMVRRLKREVLRDMPSKLRSVIEIPAAAAGEAVSKEQAAVAEFTEALYDLRLRVEMAKASDDKAAYDEAVKKLKDGASAAFGEISKLRHDTALAKVPAVTEHIKAALEAGSKAVVFAHHHDVLDAYVEAYGKQAVKLDGTMSQVDRQSSIDRFQRDASVKLFVGSIQAAGTGITLTESSHVIFAELDWVPGNMSQAEDRCHRIGQFSNVLVEHLVLEGSLDATMARVLVRKQAVIDAALDSEGAELAGEALAPISDEHATANASRERIAREAALLTSDNIREITASVRAMHGAGLVTNRIDKALLAQIAGVRWLTPKQAAVGLRIVKKYGVQEEQR